MAFVMIYITYNFNDGVLEIPTPVLITRPFTIYFLDIDSKTIRYLEVQNIVGYQYGCVVIE